MGQAEAWHSSTHPALLCANQWQSGGRSRASRQCPANSSRRLSAAEPAHPRLSATSSPVAGRGGKRQRKFGEGASCHPSRSTCRQLLQLSALIRSLRPLPITTLSCSHPYIRDSAESHVQMGIASGSNAPAAALLQHSEGKSPQPCTAHAQPMHSPSAPAQWPPGCKKIVSAVQGQHPPPMQRQGAGSNAQAAPNKPARAGSCR